MKNFRTNQRQELIEGNDYSVIRTLKIGTAEKASVKKITYKKGMRILTGYRTVYLTGHSDTHIKQFLKEAWGLELGKAEKPVTSKAKSAPKKTSKKPAPKADKTSTDAAPAKGVKLKKFALGNVEVGSKVLVRLPVSKQRKQPIVVEAEVKQNGINTQLKRLGKSKGVVKLNGTTETYYMDTKTNRTKYLKNVEIV